MTMHFACDFSDNVCKVSCPFFMHFYTFDGHFEYLKVTEVTNLTFFINVPSITLLGKKQNPETPSH